MSGPDDNLACDYVLDRLDQRARADFEARLVADPDLRQRVRVYEAGLAERIGELAPRTPSAAVWAGIANRIGRAPRRDGRRWAPVLKWGIAAVIALSLASIAVERWIDRPYVVVVALGRGESQPSRIPVARVARSANAAFAQLAALAAYYWEDGRPQKAFVLYDPSSSQGFIAVRDLPAPAAGFHYQVWILDRRTHLVRPAGAIPASGLFSFAVDPLPDEATDDLRVLVTREAGNAVRPGPDVILGG
ncbi:MAG TPA: anti-sigma factor [Opitutaceae bacterium]|jgi:hypothetical protein|nr:anti-sigma factor [Opitutaceae bacterium]